MQRSTHHRIGSAQAEYESRGSVVRYDVFVKVPFRIFTGIVYRKLDLFWKHTVLAKTPLYWPLQPQHTIMNWLQDRTITARTQTTGVFKCRQMAMRCQVCDKQKCVELLICSFFRNEGMTYLTMKITIILVNGIRRISFCEGDKPPLI